MRYELIKLLSALLEESLNDETVKSLIDWSFQATAVKKKRV